MHNHDTDQTVEFKIYFGIWYRLTEGIFKTPDGLRQFRLLHIPAQYVQPRGVVLRLMATQEEGDEEWFVVWDDLSRI